jgi:hypothetical protein
VGKVKFFGVCRVEMVVSDRSSAGFGSISWLIAVAQPFDFKSTSNVFPHS